MIGFLQDSLDSGRFKRLCATICAMSLVCATLSHAVDGKESSSTSSSSKKTVPKNDDPTSTLNFVAGVMLGTLLEVDLKEKFIFVKPKERQLARRMFYFDSGTFFTKKKKNFDRKKLRVGDDVAVRYYGAAPNFLAEEIFVVEDGEFEMSTYRKRRKN